MSLTPIDADNRIQLPAEWTQALGLQGLVALERTPDGILIRPAPRLSWDEVFAAKLVVGSAVPDLNPDDGELTGDDFLF